jgi:HAD superfamily hydrolase (TIGR01509 family)
MMISRERRFDAVTLDMGYTLIAAQDRFDLELIEFAAKAGLTRTRADVQEAFRLTWEERMRIDATQRWEPSLAADKAMGLEIDRAICRNIGITDPVLQEAVHVRSQQIFEDPTNYCVFPEAVEAVLALRARGLTVGVLSNWGWRLPELGAALCIDHYFDFIITSARIGASKPNPAIFYEALACAGSLPERTMHVGDSLIADVQGAQGVGITGVLIDRAGLVQPNGYPVVRSLMEVPALIDSL